MQFAAMVANMSEDTFGEVIAASPRKIRETLFTRMNIKAKKTLTLKVHSKLEDRSKKLHERLKSATSQQEDKLCEELIRNWLYTKRPMLKATLDHLGIKNDNGLVDEDPTFFAELSTDKTRALVAAVKGGGYVLEHLAIYLRFVGVPNVDEAMKAAA
jgi:hypothetical protein